MYWLIVFGLNAGVVGSFADREQCRAALELYTGLGTDAAAICLPKVPSK